METTKFKTNLKCSGCVDTVKKFLDQEKRIHRWNVELDSPDRIITVEYENMNPDEIIQKLKEAGYKAEVLK